MDAEACISEAGTLEEAEVLLFGPAAVGFPGVGTVFHFLNLELLVNSYS